MGEPRQDYFKTVDSDDFSNILAKDPILQSLWRFVSERKVETVMIAVIMGTER